MIKWVILFLLFLLNQSTIVRAQNLILVDDATGVNISESEINQIESLIDGFQVQLPDSGQMDFKVIVGGLYLSQHYYQGGYSTEINRMTEDVNSEYPYHLLIIKFIHNQSGEINWNVFVSLPDTGIFLCKEPADIGIISETIKQNLNKEDDFVQTISSALSNINVYVEKLNDCCAEEGRESCELLCLSEEFNFSGYLIDLGLQFVEHDMVVGNYQGSTNVIISSQLKIDNSETLVTDLQALLEFEFGSATTKKIHILDKYAFCQINLKEYLDDPNVFAVLILDEDENGNGRIYSYIDLPCFFSLGGGLNTFLATASPDEFEEFLWWIAYYREHTNIHPSLHVQLAIYKTCLSTPLHTSLAVAGFFCDLCDLVDAGIYALEGDYLNGTLSLIAVAPIVGSPLKASFQYSIKIIGVSGRKITLHFTKEGVRYFGRSTQLATVIGKQSGKAAHHIIPWNLFQNLDKYPGLKKLVEAGFHPNQMENGMHLSQKIKSKNWAGEVVEHTFHGNHPAYDIYVLKLMKEKFDNYGNNINDFHDEILTDLIPFLRSKIMEAENLIKTNLAWSGKTLNDYFAELNKL